MRFPQRVLIFLLGALIGSIGVAYIMKHRGLEKRPGPPQTVEEAEMEAVSGILNAYETRRIPLESPYLVGEYEEPGEVSGEWRRVLLLRGRLPGQQLRLVETQRRSPDGRIEVIHWRVMAADRVVIRLEAGSPPSALRLPLAEWGYRLLKKSQGLDAYVVELSDADPSSVDRAIKRIRGIGSPVVYVDPDYLDNEPGAD